MAYSAGRLHIGLDRRSGYLQLVCPYRPPCHFFTSRWPFTAGINVEQDRYSAYGVIESLSRHLLSEHADDEAEEVAPAATRRLRQQEE